MAALDVLLGAEDDRYSLVFRVLAEEQDGLVFAADRAGGAALEVNGAAEDLFRALHQRTGSMDLAHSAFAELLNGQINVRRVAPAGEVAEVGAQRRAVARKGNLMVGVNSAVAELEGDEVEPCVFGELRAQLVAQHRAPRGIQKLHDAKVRALRRCEPELRGKGLRGGADLKDGQLRARPGGHGIDAAAVGCAAVRSLDAERGVFAGNGGEALA